MDFLPFAVPLIAIAKPANTEGRGNKDVILECCVLLNGMSSHTGCDLLTFGQGPASLEHILVLKSLAHSNY